MSGLSADSISGICETKGGPSASLEHAGLHVCGSVYYGVDGSVDLRGFGDRGFDNGALWFR